MRFFAALLCLLVLVQWSCAPEKPANRMTDEELKAYANELAQKYIIADGHIDLPSVLLEKKWRAAPGTADTLLHTAKGEFDYERARKGGLDAPFMSIYIPAANQKFPDQGKNLADSLIDMVISIADLLPDKFALANTPAQVEANLKAGKISLPMGMENGAPIGNDLKNINYFFNRGIRYITLTHGKDNQICDSSTDTTQTWNGLSPFGKEVVAEMNRVGIMVDISHVHDSTFYQVMRLSKAPAIASHSDCKHFAPTVKRDMTDNMIKALGKKEGVMMINFYTAFLDSAVANSNKLNREQLNVLLKEKNLKEDDTLALPVIAQFKKDHPAATTNVEMVANHIDHVVKLAGIDHVGIGSDYDGVDGSVPTGLEDVSTYPNLIYVLLKRGYTEEDIEKICYKNLWRVWNKTAEVAAKLQQELSSSSF